MSQIPGKIVISNSTNVTLNDRFGKLAQAKPLSSVPKANSLYAKVNQGNDQATIKNRELALQMAKRPTVQAALKTKVRNLKQRVGNTEGKANNGKNEMKMQPQKSNVKSRIDLAARLSLHGIPLRKTAAGFNFNKNRLMAKDNKGSNFKRVAKSGPKPKQGGVKRLNKNFKSPKKAEEPKEKTREGLDMELESYMAKSKGHLDADLDVYMSHATTN